MENEQALFGKCPYLTAQKLITGKYAMLVLHFLAEREPQRFGELSRKLPYLTQAALTKQLRSLEQGGLVHREVYPEVPPRVEYSLTAVGREFLPVLDAFEVFGGKYIEHLNVGAQEENPDGQAV